MTLLVADSDFTLYVGDVRHVLAELESESVHCVVTSPPYWGLRDYGIDGQLGLEPTPDRYVENMVGVFREVRRVLRRDGTCWLNIGDSYATTPTGNRGTKSALNGAQTSEKYAETLDRYTEAKLNRAAIPDGLKAKDLCGIPWRLAFALQHDGWYLRAEIIWAKPNPMPESVTDRPTKSHEQVFLLTRSPRYFYDADAVRETLAIPLHAPGNRKWPDGDRNDGDRMEAIWGNPAGRNLRSVWEIPTEPFPQAHFATYPQALVERCVKAGTSERGCCPECGAPWQRETEPGYSIISGKGWHDHSDDARQGMAQVRKGQAAWDTYVPSQTIGWRPTCGCVEAGLQGRVAVPTGVVDGDDVAGPGPERGVRPGRELGAEGATPVPSVVLDPFIGSGTTALVARRLGRKCVGIELSPDYAQICLQRTRQLSLLAQ